MDAAADALFQRLHDAGLKFGVCVRYSQIVGGAGTERLRHQHREAQAFEILEAKIRYARQRWGAALFYIDSNVKYTADDESTGKTLDAQIFHRLARRHPDVLLIPEFGNLEYHSACAVYRELREHELGGYARTPERIRKIYPRAFSVIKISDGPIRQRRRELATGVAEGDILMGRVWYPAPDLPWIRRIYREAKKLSR